MFKVLVIHTPRRNMTLNRCVFVVVLVLQLLMKKCCGQGRLLEPPGRSSMWRFGYDTPINYNDNVISCGGVKRQWEVNNGACGICGDPWDAKPPRDHERGGVYVTDKISASYPSGSVINIITDVVNTKGGYFEFRLCKTGNSKHPVTQTCLDNGLLKTVKGCKSRYTDILEGANTVQLQLPPGLTCDRCLLQWKYTTADHWGCEPTDQGKERCCFGCGKIQTTYYACADIAIYNKIPRSKGMTLENSVSREWSGNQNNTATKRTKRQTAGFPGYNPVLNTLNRFSPGMITIPNAQNVQWSWTARLRNRPLSPASILDMINTRSGNLRTYPQSFMAHMQSSRTINGQGQQQMLTVPEPVRSMVRVKQPIAKPLFGATSAGIPIRSSLYQPGSGGNERQLLMDPAIARKFNRHMMTKRPSFGNECKSVGPFRTRAMDRWCDSNCLQGNCIVDECRCPGRPRSDCSKCPYGLCLDDMLELQKLFPGLFTDPVTFLDCQYYEERLFNLKSFKILSEGIPECKHPRFKRQIHRMQSDDDDGGCCGTRPQVIMPLTVESDNETFHVVQLPNDNSQFLVQGICGHNSTFTCPVCSPEHNFQWILVYDPRLRSSPAVNFVPVRFPHYCRCRNPGRVFG